MPLGAQQLERVADERELEHHKVPHQVGEARARGPRRRLDLDQAERGADVEVVAGLEVELAAGRRPRAGLTASSSVDAVGGVRVREGWEAWRRSGRARTRPRPAPTACPRAAPSARASPRSPPRRPRRSASPRRSPRRPGSAPPARPRSPAAARGAGRRGGAARRPRSAAPRRASASFTRSGSDADQLQVEHRPPRARSARSGCGAGLRARSPAVGISSASVPAYFGDEVGHLLRLDRRRRCSAA